MGKGQGKAVGIQVTKKTNSLQANPDLSGQPDYVSDYRHSRFNISPR